MPKPLSALRHRAPRFLAAAAVVVIACGGGFLLGSRYLAPHKGSDPAADPYRHRAGEIVLVYVGSVSCGHSKDPRVGQAVRSAQEKLRLWARERDLGFSSIGIAAAAESIDGFNHLSEVAEFSERSAGQAWTNLALLWLAKTHPEVSLGSPQVILLARRWSVHDRPVVLPTDSLSERVIVNVVGADAIHAWAESDWLLPSESERFLASQGSEPAQ